ncbi:MAG: prevent-host-death family protein [Verrucomicrobiales bacterium]|jgi:prevent-host-death family protein
MVTNLRDAKTRFSELVQLAAGDEEIIITVRGQPTARLITAKSPENAKTDRAEWVAELSAAAEAAQASNTTSTPQSFWDESREDRF